MKTRIVVAILIVLLATGNVFSVSMAAQSVSVGIYSIAACKDVTKVTVQGSSTYSNNRLDVGVFYRNDKGEWKLFRQVFTAAFASGPFMMTVPLTYADDNTRDGEVLRVDVQVQRLSGNSYVNVGPLLTQNVTTADRYCLDKCNVTVDTSDKAPASGTITLRSHFGKLFRPEGRLQGAHMVVAGQKARIVFVGVPCDWTVRAWYYPNSGKDKTPKLLPSQYWPNDFQANELNGTNPYTTSFAKAIAATAALEEDDPFVVK